MLIHLCLLTSPLKLHPNRIFHLETHYTLSSSSFQSNIGLGLTLETSCNKDSKFLFVELINAPLTNMEPTLAIGLTYPSKIPADQGKNEKYLGTI